ncbi:MAG TPA: bifunctional UDP-N-acetylglucosamine diphosphorylase/glucosamine-1-phosphate N-acetyltransferase GlmU [Steroidobacteraceae bacterium]|jgi:bifunctional UDP-N-acetylglucosamine pyrophosphorylase/glucosamine-1-phosphate N-acetyltransferase|nr:bifunctional UDP-N-acetylglucosamine diphosphorylase/glucosamine-1-phosphate N-acetyltransferase GlmU [Steroidobacteraceae bacterium]
MPERRSRPKRPRRTAAARRRKTKPSAAAPLTIVILAAGEGKRMKSALPKVLQPLAGRPLLKHVIDTARSLEPSAIHVVYGHGGERVRAALADEAVSWTLQPERLGTGHAVLQAMPQIPDSHTVLVLYGDVPLISRATLARLLALAGPRQLALLTVRLADPQGYGRIVRGRGGLVQRIVEEKDATRAQLRIDECNTGVLVSPARLLRAWLVRLRTNNAQREYLLTDVIAMAVRDRIAVKALAAHEASEVLGVNDQAQLAALESVCRARTAHALMLGGVTLADPARLDVRGALAHGGDVFIDVNVVFEGQVRLGDRVRIGAGCVIRDSEIGDDTQVFPHCVIDGARIGPGCLIGPFARLRPAAQLAAGVHLGNFVEVKNAHLGESSKANHLSYVGDAQVGSRVNIGAGTIVANYDGARKHHTSIGDEVWTGSNSVLVAPITVGAGATIAAGSTVTHSVPAGKLTLARARQVTVEGWRRPTKPK